MGGSSYSDDFYEDRQTQRQQANIPVFHYHQQVTTGQVAAKVHDSLNINGKIRESRDSDAHPESLAIAVIFDQTGSMGSAPRTLQKKIPSLMKLLLDKQYVEHPQICFGAVGDYRNRERAPLQIGQFESGVEMDDDINNLYLEGNGGGNGGESYGNVFYYFGTRTSIDCLEKRGRKGYLFVIGDEYPHPRMEAGEIHDLMGVSTNEPITIEQAVAKAKEKYNVYFIIPEEGTSYGGNLHLKKRWTDLLGTENVLILSKNEAVCELIATTIGIVEGVIDSDGVKRDLADIGAAHVSFAVSKALAPVLANSAGLSRTGSGNLPVRSGTSNTTRL